MLKRSFLSVSGIVLLAAAVGCGAGDGVSPGQLISLRIEAVDADEPQQSMVGTELLYPLAVRVRSGDRALPEVLVAWSTASGRVLPDTAFTDQSGIARVHWILGDTPGPVEAHASLVATPEQQVTFTALALRRIRATLAPVAGTVSATSPVALTVKVVDAVNSEPCPGIQISWFAKGASDPSVGSGEFVPSVSTTNADGIATTGWTPRRVGGFVIKASVLNYDGYYQLPDTIYVEAIP